MNHQYGLVGVVVSAGWLRLYHYLSRHGELQRHVTFGFFVVERLRAVRDHGLHAVGEVSTTRLVTMDGGEPATGRSTDDPQ
ncbi:hypothetical protein ACLQ22_22515 [Micromonospora sp. DT178]|uniref:hypothetical protein n=1 Tax=Micromonospora sp. DT178 TaxID=3393436 RepID=UPI003CEDD7C2